MTRIERMADLENGAALGNRWMKQNRPGSRFGPSLIEQIWRAVLNYKWTLLLIVAGCLILGLIATLLMTREYTAAARIEISRQQENVTNVEGLQPTSPGVDLEFYETQYSLLGARSLAERVARSLNLATDDSFFATFGVDPDADGLLSLESNGRVTAQQRTERMEEATDILLENVSIAPVRGSSLVDVKFTSPDPKLSARIANAWVEQFIQANLDRRFASTQDARDYLEERLAQLRERLQDSEQQLVNYASANEILTLAQSRDSEGRTTGEQTLVGTDLQAMNQALAQARADRIQAESRYRQGGGQRDSLNNQAINRLREARAELVAERARLLTQFEPQYPTVEAVSSQLQALDGSIAAEEARVRSTARADFEQAVQRERELAERVEFLKGRFIGQNRDSIQYNIFQREVDTNRQLYDALLQRFKEIGVAGVGSNNIAVVDPATVPEDPSRPNMGMNLAISFLLGLALAGAYLFAREQIDQTLRDPGAVRDHLGLSLLGVVPGVQKEEIMEDLRDPKSAVSEAYFSIGTTLSFLTEHGVPRSILLTSTQPNEGKSTSTQPHAAVLGRTGRRTLIIDADQRNPSLHEFYGQPNDVGFSNVLSGNCDLAEVIKETNVPGVSFVAAGPVPPNPAELLAGTRLPEVIRRAAEQFDQVIVDAPPILGFADVPLLAKSVEGVIFTVQANGAKFRAIQSALDRLNSGNAQIFGAIVTKLGARDSAYGYGYGYGYGQQTQSKQLSPA